MGERNIENNCDSAVREAANMIPTPRERRRLCHLGSPVRKPPKIHLPVTALGRSRPAADATREAVERWLLDGLM
jgi:hypothetical protein